MSELTLALSPADKARMNHPRLLSLLRLSDPDYAAFETAHGKQYLWTALAVDKSNFKHTDSGGNHTVTVLGLRKIVRAYPFVQILSAGVPKALMDGFLRCVDCHGDGAVIGTFRISAAAAMGHSLTQAHVKAQQKKLRLAEQAAAIATISAAASAEPGIGAASMESRKRPRQLTMEDAGGVAPLAELDEDKLNRVLLGGLLLVSGVVPTTAGNLLDGTALQLISALRSGTVSARTLVDVDMPSMVRLVKDYIRHHLKGRDLALATDVGSSELDLGVRVQVSV
jgi:hypothetical protein